MAIDQVIKRDGRRVPFDRKRIENAIYAAARAVGNGEGRQWAETLSWAVTGILEERFGQEGHIPHVEEIQDIVEEVLIKSGHPQIAKAYILYRQKRAEARAAEQMLLDTTQLVDDYLDQTDWRVSENSNMNYSLQGLNFYLASSIAARYWLHKIYPPEVQRAHIEGDFHIHDLGMLSSYTYYGKEVVILKDRRGLHLTSFEQAYAGCPEPEMCLNEADDAFAKYPQDCFVLDKDGWTRVVRLVRKRKDRPMRFIKNRGGRSVIVTDNHPMITGNGERLAADVRPHIDALYTMDLRLLLSEENLFSETEIDLLSELQGAAISSIGRDLIYFNGVPIAEIDIDQAGEGVIHTYTQTIPRRLRLTADFGYFVGFALAEGYLSYDTKASRTVSITQKDPDALHAINRALIALGIPGCIVRRSDAVYELQVKNVFLRFLFEHVFRIQPGARHKSLPVRTLHYNTDFVQGMLAGVIDGDGSITGNDSSVAIRVSSRTLLEQMACVLHLLGATPRDRNIEGVGTCRTYKGRVIVQRFPLYGLSFRKTAGLALPSSLFQSAAVSARAWQDETRNAWHAVLNNEPTEIPDGEIYDITTESGTLIVNGMWNHNCTGWDLQDLLIRGFGGVPAKIESRPPRHLRTALGQLVNFFYTVQGEVAGAVAVSNFDTLLAPFIRYDRLDEAGVKQAVQEFIFNINVPTRVGFQCLSEDTEILTAEGWRSYAEVAKDDVIFTFNLTTHRLERKPVTGIFVREYEGVMYRLLGRSQDQIVSPGHRVVRHNTNGYILEPVEEVVRFKSPVSIPVSAENDGPDADISDEQLKLLAWMLSEGSLEKGGSYPSRAGYPENGREIVDLLNKFGLEFRKTQQEGRDTRRHQGLTPEAGRMVHSRPGEKGKTLPPILFRFSKRQARLFLETYANEDGWTEKSVKRIVVTDKEILDGLQALAVLAGFNFVVQEREPEEAGRKTQYILTLTETRHDSIQSIEKVDYRGIIWSVHTENETVIARRNGQVFITGNTPFTNLTFDLVPPSTLRDQPVIIGGKPQEAAYGEFQREMDLLNRTFAEVMLEGDARGRVFTFPIPTYNITRDFDWENPALKPVWDMTARYGIPYFGNYVNSDMRPEDARSMCCRLRLDNRELRRRPGGLFAAAPLTGSVGVVTINMPRLAYLAEDEEDFFRRLERLMEIARTSLEIKRKMLEHLTERGLYPYSRHYLEAVKMQTGAYWSNHFSTIGLIGMNEACLNLLGVGIAHPEGKALAIRTLNFMRQVLSRFQEETGNLYNLEATPAEGASYRLARADRKRHPNIRTAGTPETPYYTNSTHLPVSYSDDLFEVLEHQDELQTLYTGGTVLHIFLGERLHDGSQARRLVRLITENYRLPYFTITPTFSICPVHGYIPGEHFFCPYEHTAEELARYGVTVKGFDTLRHST